MLHADRAQVDRAIAALHNAPPMAYVDCTGAGAGLFNLLWSVAGSSRTLIAAEFPYDGRAVAQLIGREPQQFCSQDTAIALAAAGYLKAQRCLVEQGRFSTPIIAVGLTAAVSTDRSRRGDDRVFVAMRTATQLATVAGVFERGALDRAGEGEVCDLLALSTLLWAAGIDQPLLVDTHLHSEQLLAAGTLAPAPVEPGVSEAGLPLALDADGRALPLAALSPETHILFPGSFNPFHYGHDQIAQAVQALTGKQVVFEIAAVNADKPGIARDVLSARALQFRGRWPVLLTENLPLFIDKARALGPFSFVLGLDTAVRLFDPRYFGGEAARDAIIDEFRQLGVRFYVCNRGDEPGGLDSLISEPRFFGLFVPLPMLIPVSSTELRAETGASS